ncbi:Glutathione-dependent formaldehyde-activating enzyme [Aspergillus parasiticus SU-1]|uniref:Glutathione-dependent formaldehyde-activating enzyme n=1 Tax=Aspergillus parasiticus (strain ATCC 56775 / NRRL 5862 / SRRC 143 / SU-1) TaxID=1403190 RepID=A0A0F0IJ86_ASPPU|nr:Glutathione-dependent formaldehyde-activating enzyme [Aspergillus parasiticus SU-1]
METYNANCHCGAVRFSFSLAPLKTIKINRCNCSICTKNSYLLVYPLRKDVVFHRGEDQLAEYRFGNRTKPHKFCPNCGTSAVVSDPRFALLGKLWLSVSVVVLMGSQIHTIQGIEDVLDELDYRAVDGKNRLGPPYSV